MGRGERKNLEIGILFGSYILPFVLLSVYFFVNFIFQKVKMQKKLIFFTGTIKI